MGWGSIEDRKSEVPALTARLPEGGAEYSLDLVPDGAEGWQLVPAEAA